MGIMDTRHKIIVSDEEYWKIQELKTIYKTKKLLDILNKVPSLGKSLDVETQQFQELKEIDVFLSKNKVDKPSCMCGHEKRFHAHGEGHCFATGGRCGCDKYHEAL